MTAKRLATLIVLLVASIGAVAQNSRHPEKKGAVIDYAGKLDQAQINELAGLIDQYERQTSIEFAVVVVDSLRGDSAKNYAQHIGDSWGVGKAGRNNGIVLLWAPNERAYSLRIADGLSADLSDVDAPRITQENLLPNFKRGEYYTGLKQTVLATMRQLGGQSWEERVQARAQAAQASRETQRFAVWSVVGVIVIVSLAVLIAVAVRRSRHRKEKLAEMADASRVIADSVRNAEQNAPRIQQLLNDLSKEAPEQDIGKLFSDLAGQPSRIANIKSDVARLNFTDLECYDEAIRIRASAETEGAFLGNMQQRVAEIKQARERSRVLMEQLSRQKFEVPEVRDSSRRAEVDELLDRSRRMYEQARQDSSMSIVDWLIIHQLLNNSQNQAQQAIEVSQAQPQGFSYSSADSSDSSSSFFSGDSSASFGGGGGFSGGSGSDGTY